MKEQRELLEELNTMLHKLGEARASLDAAWVQLVELRCVVVAEIAREADDE